VLGPTSKIALNPNETTIAEVLKPLGYSTACFGKWHLSSYTDGPEIQGFDEYAGLLFSNDMWPPNGNWPKLYFWGEQSGWEIKGPEDQNKLTETYTRRTLQFIRKNKKKPFFIYLAHSMMHVPIAASKKFRGRSNAGLYGDALMEIDSSTGAIMKELANQGIEKNTIVIFSSDNGPWLPYGDHAGSSGGLREGKGTTFEGGFRVPGIFSWPSKFPAGKTVGEVVSTMDVLPTIAALTKAKPGKLKIDGHDISNLLYDVPGAVTPWKWFFYYWPWQLQAVRSGDWKLHVPHEHRHQGPVSGSDGRPFGETTQKIGLSLFNLRTDPSEKINLAEQHPDIVRRLLTIMEMGREELGDTLTKTIGKEVRPPHSGFGIGP
jgi:arylsulfatase